LNSFAPNQDFGPYTLIDQIAVGGMAEIYLAKTKGVAGFEKVLALKVIHPNYADDDQFIQMLIDEAKISVGLSHTNICQIFDLGQVADTYYISMEFIDGFDLFKIMRRLSEMNIDVPIESAVYIAQEICCGLDYAHRWRIREIRPIWKQISQWRAHLCRAPKRQRKRNDLDDQRSRDAETQFTQGHAVWRGRSAESCSGV
jgi:hypothetical protein